MFGHHLFDRDGNPLTTEEFCELFQPEYQRVAEDTVGDYWISTAWLGIDYRFVDDGPPLIFETMLFWRGEGPEPEYSLDNETHRYSTELEAIEGHLRIVEQLTLLQNLTTPGS